MVLKQACARCLVFKKLIGNTQFYLNIYFFVDLDHLFYSHLYYDIDQTIYLVKLK